MTDSKKSMDINPIPSQLAVTDTQEALDPKAKHLTDDNFKAMLLAVRKGTATPK